MKERGAVMPLTAKYLVAQKNIPEVFEKIISGAVPDKFSLSHLQGLGFTSSNDRGFLSLLKDLGFLRDDGSPTQRYKDYRDRSRSRAVMAEALRDAYGDLFLIKEKGLSKSDRDAIVGRFKSTHGSNDGIARLQAATFLALAELADLDAPRTTPALVERQPEDLKSERLPIEYVQKRAVDLRYTIEVHLPATKDMEVYSAIFQSMRKHLLDE
jgi:hypothetical protein